MACHELFPARHALSLETKANLRHQHGVWEHVWGNLRQVNCFSPHAIVCYGTKRWRTGDGEDSGQALFFWDWRTRYRTRSPICADEVIDHLGRGHHPGVAVYVRFLDIDLILGIFVGIAFYRCRNDRPPDHHLMDWREIFRHTGEVVTDGITAGDWALRHVRSACQIRQMRRRDRGVCSGVPRLLALRWRRPRAGRHVRTITADLPTGC
jgi:hypothetical protein